MADTATAEAPCRGRKTACCKALSSPLTVIGLVLVGAASLVLALFAPLIAPYAISAIFHRRADTAIPGALAWDRPDRAGLPVASFVGGARRACWSRRSAW